MWNVGILKEDFRVDRLTHVITLRPDFLDDMVIFNIYYQIDHIVRLVENAIKFSVIVARIVSQT